MIVLIPSFLTSWKKIFFTTETLIYAIRSQANFPIDRAKSVKHSKNTQGYFAWKIWNIIYKVTKISPVLDTRKRRIKLWEPK